MKIIFPLFSLILNVHGLCIDISSQKAYWFQTALKISPLNLTSIHIRGSFICNLHKFELTLDSIILYYFGIDDAVTEHSIIKYDRVFTFIDGFSWYWSMNSLKSLAYLTSHRNISGLLESKSGVGQSTQSHCVFSSITLAFLQH